MKIIRDNMFYIGMLLFSVTMLLEHLFLKETGLTAFFKGFACGIQIVGIIFLIKNKKNK